MRTALKFPTQAVQKPTYELPLTRSRIICACGIGEFLVTQSSTNKTHRKFHDLLDANKATGNASEACDIISTGAVAQGAIKRRLCRQPTSRSIRSLRRRDVYLCVRFRFCTALIGLHILNFSASCRNHSHSVGYNAATQDGKVYISEGDSRLPLVYRQPSVANNGNNAWTISGYGATGCTRNVGQMSNEEATFLCHTHHGEQCTDSSAGLTGLAFALTVHAVLEGLAIGLQTQITEVRGES